MVPHEVWFGEIINDADTTKGRNILVLSRLETLKENYKNFNGKKEDKGKSITSNSLWFLLYAIATDAHGN